MTSKDGIARALDATPAIGVREAVARHLLKTGWQQLEQEPVGPVESGAFSIAVSPDFSATIWILPRVGGALHDAPELFVVGLAGLDYMPARKITTALVGCSYSGVVLKEPCHMIALAHEVEANHATDALIRFASEQHIRWRDGADIDTVIGMLNRGEATASTRPTALLDETLGDQREDRAAVIVALLAAGGRYDEARCALSSLTVSAENGDLTPRRYARQLARWIDSKGTLTLPASPPQWGPRRPSRLRRPEAGGHWTAHRQSAIARREAIETVGPLCRGKSRDEIRSLLEGEFQKRQLSISPPSVERDVDLLLTEQKPYGKLAVAIRGIRAIAEFMSDSRTEGGGLERVLAEVPADETEVLAAAELRLPERAAYPIYASGDPSVAVTIDGAATRLLEDIMQGRRRNTEDAVRIQVWLSPDVSSTNIDVHVGEQRVGQLDGDRVTHFEQPIAAAAERDEVPWTDAWLVQRSEEPVYMLDLALPEAKTRPAG